MKNTGVMLADDHTLLRSTLAVAINKLEGFEVIAEAANGKEVIDLIDKGKVPQVLVLDLSMPVLDGYDTAKILHKKNPEINILILTMYHTELVFLELFNLGVKGILKKDILPSEMEKALTLAASSQYYFSYCDMHKITSNFKKKKNLLDNNEKEFLRLSATEDTYKLIANKMKLTERQVDHLRDCLFEKLEIKSRVGLAMYAIKSGLVNINDTNNLLI